MRTSLLSNRLLALIVITVMGSTFFTACNDDDDDTSTPPASTPAVIDFGYAYGIIDGASSPNGIPLPVLSGDSVYVRLGYSGCSPDHEFELRSRVLSGDRAEIWFEKITPDEACQAFFSPEIVERVPFSVLEKENIALVGPFFANYTLR